MATARAAKFALSAGSDGSLRPALTATSFQCVTTAAGGGAADATPDASRNAGRSGRNRETFRMVLYGSVGRLSVPGKFGPALRPICERRSLAGSREEP